MTGLDCWPLQKRKNLGAEIPLRTEQICKSKTTESAGPESRRLLRDMLAVRPVRAQANHPENNRSAEVGAHRERMVEEDARNNLPSGA